MERKTILITGNTDSVGQVTAKMLHLVPEK